jgi:hypothetical protein
VGERQRFHPRLPSWAGPAFPDIFVVVRSEGAEDSSNFNSLRRKLKSQGALA